MSSIAIGNALGATCHYQQEAFDISIGACTNNRTVRSTQATAKILLTRLYYKVYFMLNNKIDINKKKHSNAALFNAHCK